MSTAAIPNDRIQTSHSLTRVGVSPRLLMIAGAASLAVALGMLALGSAASRFAHAYLLGISFCLSISLGAMFFVILQHLTHARWSVTARRLAELLASPIPMLGILFVPVLLSMFAGSGALYHWNDAEAVAADALLQHKTPFLNAPFFAVRCVIYFAAWMVMSRFFLRNSVALDDGNAEAISRMRRYSGPAMLVYALTVNFAAFDLLMSLDPHWFSTIYGVYFFGDCAVAFFATLPLLVMFVQSRGVLKEAVTVEHFHDFAKLLFGFVFFWSYIAFSQYMLIWYANIPEETGWFSVRQNHGWGYVSLVLLIGHFALPFAGLMSRSVRRNRRLLAGWCVFLLAVHAVDLYWLIMPSVSPGAATPAGVDLLCLLGVSLIWLGALLRGLLKHQLLSTGDPNLETSLAFHNV